MIVFLFAAVTALLIIMAYRIAMVVWLMFVLIVRVIILCWHLLRAGDRSPSGRGGTIV
jgi:hypothetical protein